MSLFNPSNEKKNQQNHKANSESNKNMDAMNETLSHHFNLLFDWRFADFNLCTKNSNVYREQQQKRITTLVDWFFRITHANHQFDLNYFFRNQFNAMK